MSDSRGDVAYLMADISNVGKNGIKEIYQSLEDLARRSFRLEQQASLELLLTNTSEDSDSSPILRINNDMRCIARRFESLEGDMGVQHEILEHIYSLSEVKDAMREAIMCRPLQPKSMARGKQQLIATTIDVIRNCMVAHKIYTS